MPNLRRKRLELIEERLTFTRLFGDRTWKATLDEWLTLCNRGPHEWFVLPDDLGELDLVISTSPRDGYLLKKLKIDSSLYGAYWGKEYVSFSAGINSWLIRLHRRHLGRSFYAAIEFPINYRHIL